MNETLEGKRVLVTGAARGLGRALCESLCRAGARVALADIRAGLAEQACEELRAQGFDAMHHVLDIRDPLQIERTSQAIHERFGDLDILVNSAAIDYTLPIDELTIEQWDEVMATNLRGPFLLTKYVVDAMKQRGSGDIINITSTAAKRAWPNASVYHASKWALLGFSHALHSELRPHGIRVTAVVAGGMRTPFLLDRFPDIDPALLQPPENVADMIVKVLTLPRDSVVPEISILPMRETSWP
ncbi:SDR family oxidoreductase [Uliginosibacterium paludis]|uniref:SDR family oxidoreductase n=1 Tax=Uliginosibacterium paludis TaxID=1615952 RepID=A0ABV2CT26_9RHOO